MNASVAILFIMYVHTNSEIMLETDSKIVISL